MGFLETFLRPFRRNRKKSQTIKSNHAPDGSTGIEPTQSSTSIRQTSSTAASDDENRYIEVASSLCPPSRLRATPSSAAVSVEEGHFEVASPRPGNEQSSSGFFTNARNVVIHNANMIDNSIPVITSQSAAMDKLSLHTEPDAAIDSSAREPAPTCHPKTRLRIREKLTILFHDENKQWRIIWLFGAAGTGKSAVCQTFASACDGRGELGAAFFFSRPNGRNKYQTVIPTLAYQLATHCLPYRSALITKVDHDLHIFNKKPPVQLKKLIIEPLLEVRSQVATTYLMLLDGIDECGANMENAHERHREQRELVKMITEAVHDYPDLPLFWLFCSRPEQHLQNAFANITTVCRHEELVIDRQCREEVEMVLREGFAKIVKERGIISPGSGVWPSQDEFNTVERAVAGLHVFGAAILKDIEHSDSPVRQLKSLIPFLKRIASTGAPGSIQVMDSFYARVLGDVPESDLATTLRIIGFHIIMHSSALSQGRRIRKFFEGGRRPESLSTQALCNFMRLDPNDFSSALQMVHSVINIPPPEGANLQGLHLYHASFSDFLTDPTRSGKFFIDKQKAQVDLVKTCFFWHGLHHRHFHSFAAYPFTSRPELSHDHGPLPQHELTWISSDDNHEAISTCICENARYFCFESFGDLSSQWNEDILSLVHQFDFRYTPLGVRYETIRFFNWVYGQDSSSGFIRTQPANDQDRLLLTYLEAVTKERVAPAQLPVDWDTTNRTAPFCEYLLLGRDSLSVVVVCTGRHSLSGRIQTFLMGLNLDREPDENTMAYYAEKVRKIDSPLKRSSHMR